MNVSRSFMLVGTLFLIAGIPIGMYMGASGDMALAPLHAHINLLGFVLMMVFGLIYRGPRAAENPMLGIKNASTVKRKPDPLSAAERPHRWRASISGCTASGRWGLR